MLLRPVLCPLNVHTLLIQHVDFLTDIYIHTLDFSEICLFFLVTKPNKTTFYFVLQYTLLHPLFFRLLLSNLSNLSNLSCPDEIVLQKSTLESPKHFSTIEY